MKQTLQLSERDRRIIAAASADEGFARWYVVEYLAAPPNAARVTAAQRELFRLGVRSIPPAAAPAAADMARAGAEVFCPVRTVRRRDMQAQGRDPLHRKRNARWIDRDVPLFPGYLFARAIDDQTLDAVCGAEYVETVLRGASEYPVEVPRGVMALLFDRQGALAEPDLSSGFAAGESVRIEAGPWRGIAGVFECDEADGRVRLFLEILGRFARVSIPSGHVAQM